MVTDRRQHWLNVLFPAEVNFPGKTEGLVVPSGFTAERPSFPTNGIIRYNKSANILEAYVNGAWVDILSGGGGGGGATNFTDLLDTPSSYTGFANRLLRVNAGQTGVEAVDGNTLFLSLGGGTLSPAADITLSGGGELVGLPPIPSASGAASKEYVDSFAAGLDPKSSCRVATTANIALVGNQTIDGVATTTGDRVLVKNQTTTSQNGIYVTSAGSWARATDQDGTPTNEVSGGNFTFIDQGTTNGGTGWVVVADGIITVNSDPMIWTQFNASGGVYLPLSGGTMSGSINMGSNSITNVNQVDGRDVSVDGSALDTHLADSSIHFSTVPYDFGSSVIGVPSASDIVFRFTTPRTFTAAPNNPTAGYAFCDTTTTATTTDAVFEVHLLGASTASSIVAGGGVSPAVASTTTLIGTVKFPVAAIEASVVELFPPGTTNTGSSFSIPVEHEIVLLYATADGGNTLGNISFTWQGETP